MLWIMIVHIFVIFLLITYILLYKKGIKNIIEKLQFIRNHDTNMNISLQLKYKQLDELAIELNQLIHDNKNEKISIAKAQQDFKEGLTNISHDLRTPLTSIAGYVQMLESEKISKQKKDEYYSIIRRRIDSLIKMLDELYDYARIESDEYQFHFDKFNVNSVLTDVVSLFYYDFVSRGNEPRIKIPAKPIYINADKDAIIRVFQNLIKNYLTHGTGEISISIEEADKKVSIFFRNHAPNLNKDEVEKIFNRFYTADRSRSNKTTGLGLSIVKNLITRMGGKVEALVENSYLTIQIAFDKFN